MGITRMVKGKAMAATAAIQKAIKTLTTIIFFD